MELQSGAVLHPETARSHDQRRVRAVCPGRRHLLTNRGVVQPLPSNFNAPAQDENQIGVFFEALVPRFLEIPGEIGAVAAKPGNLVKKHNRPCVIGDDVVQLGEGQRPIRGRLAVSFRISGHSFAEMSPLVGVCDPFSRGQAFDRDEALGRSCRRKLSAKCHFQV